MKFTSKERKLTSNQKTFGIRKKVFGFGTRMQQKLLNNIYLQGEQMTTFRKYKNRKIYSTETKGYVKLEDILSLVKDGQSVQVVSHGSGKDITSEVVREAILRSSELSTETLVDMLRGSQPEQLSLDL